MLEKWRPQRMSPRGEKPPADNALVPRVHTRPSPAIAPGPTLRSSSFGSVPWKEEDILSGMDEFLTLYAQRPVKEADGSMVSVGLFGVWFLLRAIRPHSVIECGVNSGLATWIIEKSLPNAQLLCLDLDFSRRKYHSASADYAETGFAEADLVPEGDEAAVLFDDHGDAVASVRKCLALGIHHLLFDDNYPRLVGGRHKSLAACLFEKDPDGKDRFPADKAFLLEHMETYFVFPPVFEHPDPVTLERTTIVEPSLLGRYEGKRDQAYRVFHQDMPGYRWLTYAKLK